MKAGVKRHMEVYRAKWQASTAYVTGRKVRRLEPWVEGQQWQTRGELEATVRERQAEEKRG